MGFGVKRVRYLGSRYIPQGVFVKVIDYDIYMHASIYTVGIKLTQNTHTLTQNRLRYYQSLKGILKQNRFYNFYVFYHTYVPSR